MTDDLVKRLRHRLATFGCDEAVLQMCRDAADRIEQLEQEKRLAVQAAKRNLTIRQSERARAEAAEATLHETQERLKRLEDALRALADEADGAVLDYEANPGALQAQVRAAYASLPEVKDGGARDHG